ncbi:MAG: hypothetical protein ACR2LI_05760 [Propionibacteriaceae bacterium]
MGNRLLVADRLVVGDDDNVSLEPDADGSDGTRPIAQYSLITAATQRLGR